MSVALIEFADFEGLVRAKIHVTHTGALSEKDFIDLMERFLTENGFPHELYSDASKLAAHFVIWHAMAFALVATRGIVLTTPSDIRHAIRVTCRKTPGRPTVRARLVFA